MARNGSSFVAALTGIVIVLAVGPASASAAVPQCQVFTNPPAEAGESRFIGGCSDSDGDPVSVTITPAPCPPRESAGRMALLHRSR
jgi:hypothetical protein